MKYYALYELFLCRMRQFYREPEAIFWTYGFPILLTIGLGIAFRNRPPGQVEVAVEDMPATAQIRAVLADDEGFDLQVASADECARLLRKGDVDILVVADGEGYEYRFDSTRPEATLARHRVDDALQRAAGRADVLQVADTHVTERGGRYIDFLVPGLLGMNLMGGGLWGVGFVTVDMRIRRLLKRLVATPMRKRDFLLSVIGGRMVFTLPEMFCLLMAAWLIFRIAVVGSVISIFCVAVVGALSFAGLGLLVASRARKLETISGLLNLVMLPMWVLSGTFFSASRFPDVMQPFIQALPLTQLNNALRAVILDGASLPSQALPLLILAAWGVIPFVLALRWFRWTY
ncbi:MAG TPA: ABC transporter permease [Phycisphaerae bacterium]|nr:ABC transporter permease [Phycisphaerae bacterium]